ncbi:hypothetical protein RHECNPAF_930048 [Rhizobium etli CNPAF512]|nr:hypothetical protein RHECNPAF_930048 [Rhizobium etli CNPAF512]
MIRGRGLEPRPLDLLARFGRLLSGCVIDQLVPHGVEDSEGGRQRQAEDPCEIPHRVVSSVSVTVFVGHGFLVDLAPQDLVDPGGVGDDDRQEDRRHHQHDEQRLMARRGIPDRQARSWIERGGQDEWEHRQTDRRDDAQYRDLTEDERYHLSSCAHGDEGQCGAGKAEDGCHNHPRMGAVIGKPCAVLDHHRLQQRIGRSNRADIAGDAIAADPGPEKEAAEREKQNSGKSGDTAVTSGPLRDRTARLHHQPGRAVHCQHGDGEQAAEQRIGVEQSEERAFVENPHVVGKTEGHALQHIADRNAEDQRRHETADEERPVPAAAPAGAVALRPVFEADRAQDEREEDREHREIKAREGDSIERRPGGEDGAAAEDQPDLVAFPGGADRVDRHPSFRIGPGDERQERANAKVEAACGRKSDQHDAEQQPPDDAQGFIIDEFVKDHGRSLRSRDEGFGNQRRFRLVIRFRPLSDRLDHQAHLDDDQHRVEGAKTDNGQQHRAGAEAGDGGCRRQHAFDHPGLAAEFGDHPAELDGDPGERDRQHGNPQQQRVRVEMTPRRQPEESGGQQDKEHAEADHDAEGPEERRHMRDRIARRLSDLRVGCLARIIDIALQKKGVTEIMAEILEGAAHFLRNLVLRRRRADLHQRVIGLDAVADAGFGLLFEFVDSGNFGRQRACADQAHDPRNVHGKMRFARLLIGEAEGGEGSRRRLGLPHALDCGELHLLIFGREITAFVAEHDDRERRGEAEGGGNRHRALGKLDMPALQHIPGGNAEHEDRGADITRRDRMNEFRLGDRVEDHVEEACDLHAHRLRIERRSNRVLHPAIGDEDPECGKIRAERHRPGGNEMADLRQLVPAEEEQTDEGRLQEEGHQAFDRQRRAEDVADIIAVIAPVHAELEFHDDAGGDADHEIDAE